MKNHLFRMICTGIAIFHFVPLAAVASSSDLHSYVRRYQSTKLSHEAINRISRYDHLIEYFTNFNYYVPNHKVSPEFIKALILAESGANPRAVSPKMAYGLGQIILSTGKEAGLELFKSTTHFKYVPKSTLKNITKEDLFDPATNILLTCFLISKYNYKFDGRLELVLSAWNAGENTDSLAKGNHAPYKETKDLIGKVNGYYLHLLRKKGAIR
ncbi:lytic transglycosylase domain-containing protein [Desulfopila sp. IMCC35008]|uniref:lytic transglycosylase domain-containing protein n=1 Tax=Desulfopila sp. IMCC35008 TaxID=2653858 RepID=UPI001F0EC0A8|nr:lytic transglycosylase domain-containing protein [Desulfopila sp. IMCC35008]